MRVLSIGLTALAVAFGAQAAQAAQAQAQTQANDPAATLQRYLDAVNSGSYARLVDVLSDDMAPFTYVACTPAMRPKECLATFVNETIIKRHGSLVSPHAIVKGDVIEALIEVRHDGTRAAGVPRMLGTDTITVRDNKIVSFKFVQDPNDAYNKQIAAYNAAHPPAAPAAGR